MKSKFYLRFTMVFTAILMFTFIATSQTTIEVRVAGGNDDAEEITAVDGDNAIGYMDLGSSDLELCTETENVPQIVGMLFRDVQIPVGATITNAYVQFHVDDDNEEVIALTIYGAKEANTGDIQDVAFNLSSRPTTDATVAWAPPSWLTEHDEGVDQQTPDISAVITEIIGVDGWASGNNLMILLTDPALPKAHREAESYDGEAESAPKLVVTYEEGGGEPEPEVESTIEVSITAGADDAEEFASAVGGETVGAVNLTSSDLELCFDSENQYVGMLFRDMQIPVGATVTNAYVQFTVDKAVEGVTDATIALDVYGALEATVDAITETAFNISAHPKTGLVSWAPGVSVAEGDKGVNEQTPDISAVITEIIAVDGWASGNNIMIVVHGDDAQTENINREMESYDGDPEGAPKLVVTFTSGGGGDPEPEPEPEPEIVPTITSLDVENGSAGETVIIEGTNFSWTPADNLVSFSGVAATVTASTPQKLITTVPADAVVGEVEVTVTVNGQTSESVLFTVTVPGIKTIQVRVNASEDDAEEILEDKVEPSDPSIVLPKGDVDTGSSDLELGTEVDGAPQLIGMIFRDIQIPVGATVTNAFVQFHVDDDNDDVITNTIFGALEPTIDSSFKEEPFNISSHPRTVAVVEWTPPAWLNVHEEGPDQQTPDISTIITEIISLDGWASGNSLMIMITNPTLVKEHREAESFDGESASAPQLNVTFTYEVWPTAVNEIDAQFTSRVYPNPTEGTLNIENPSLGEFSYSIYSITGKLVANRNNITDLVTKVDMHSFNSGMYFVKVQSAETTKTHKVILK